MKRYSFADLPHHAVKVILTSRVAPRDLMLAQPSPSGPGLS